MQFGVRTFEGSIIHIPDFLNSFAFMKFVVVAAPERPAIIGKNGLYYEFTFI